MAVTFALALKVQALALRVELMALIFWPWLHAWRKAAFNVDVVDSASCVKDEHNNTVCLYWSLPSFLRYQSVTPHSCPSSSSDPRLVVHVSWSLPFSPRNLPVLQVFPPQPSISLMNWFHGMLIYGIWWSLMSEVLASVAAGFWVNCKILTYQYGNMLRILVNLYQIVF